MTTDASETASALLMVAGCLSLRARRSDKKGIETILAALLMVVIVVVMSVVIYSWSMGVFGAILPKPTGGKEILTFENQKYNNSTSVTLYLRNTGTSPTTIVSYYVQDLNSNECSKVSGWSSGPYQPTTLGQVTLNIASPYCSWIGNQFAFQTGNVYTVTLVTSHSSQFAFSIQR